MTGKKRSAAQFIRDCVRCETAQTARCRCKKCNGAAHGVYRETNHPIEMLLTPNEIEQVSGINAHGG